MVYGTLSLFSFILPRPFYHGSKLPLRLEFGCGRVRSDLVRDDGDLRPDPGQLRLQAGGLLLLGGREEGPQEVLRAPGVQHGLAGGRGLSVVIYEYE